MLIADRCRVISTAYANNETLNDFYSTLLITEQNNNSRIAGALLLIQRTFFDICLFAEALLTRIEDNSFEWALLLL